MQTYSVWGAVSTDLVNWNVDDGRSFVCNNHMFTQ